jgi:hypothetical protein
VRDAFFSARRTVLVGLVCRSSADAALRFFFPCLISHPQPHTHSLNHRPRFPPAFFSFFSCGCRLSLPNCSRSICSLMILPVCSYVYQHEAPARLYCTTTAASCTTTTTTSTAPRLLMRACCTVRYTPPPPSPALRSPGPGRIILICVVCSSRPSSLAFSVWYSICLCNSNCTPCSLLCGDAVSALDTIAGGVRTTRG